MLSKKWPEDKQETIPFWRLVPTIRKAVDFAYDLTRKNKDKSIPWAGWDIGEDTKASGLSPHEALNRNNLKYDDEEQGRDAMDVIIGIALQMGIEQGKRIERKNIANDLSLMNAGLNLMQGSIGDLAKRCGEKLSS